jgi:hypothetical protein
VEVRAPFRRRRRRRQESSPCRKGFVGLSRCRDAALRCWLEAGESLLEFPSRTGTPLVVASLKDR